MNNIVQQIFQPSRAGAAAPVVDDCPAYDAAMALLGRRWAGAVIRVLLDGARRFGDLRRELPGVTDAVLTTRLRELCDAGFVTRTVRPGPPVAVVYDLTAAGRDLRPVIAAIEDFGRTHLELLRPLQEHHPKAPVAGRRRATTKEHG